MLKYGDAQVRKVLLCVFCWFGGFLYEVGLEGGLVLCVIL